MQNPKFNALFLEHYHSVYRVVHRLVGTHEEAEDLAQEAFLRLYHHLDEMDLERVHHWLHRVAVNLGLNALRGRKRLRNWQQKAAIELEVANTTRSTDPHHGASVRKTLADLPERQAQLLLFHAAGFSYDELAEAVGVQKSSISQLLMRARRAFEKTYQHLERDTLSLPG